MSFFKNWSFSRKLMAANAIYILPCAVLVYFLIQDKNAAIEFNFKERLGVEYQRPLEALLTHIGQFKVYDQELRPEISGAADRLSVLQKQIDSDFTKLVEVDARLADVLQTTPAALSSQKKDAAGAQALRSAWAAVAEKEKTEDVASRTQRLNQLIADVRLAISHIGNTSNLILDPDLDSYYMMDSTVLNLPSIKDRIQETMNYVAGLGNSELTVDQQLKLQVFASMIKSDLDKISGSIQTAITEDKAFFGSSPTLQRDMPTVLKDYIGTGESFVGGIIALASAGNTAKAGEFIASGSRALDSTLSFWSVAADELDKLIETRVTAMERARLIALILAVMAWVPAVLIAAFTIRRLNKAFIVSVSKLKTEADLADYSSSHLASASQVVSSGSTEQAAAIQETGASMSEMASMVSRSSTQALNSQDLARKVKEQTDEGRHIMKRMVLSMESIQEANAQLQNISSIISDISGKTNIINDIVSKTQLLSFNASIEAARAGQHGRGFAVVAEEVGNLAQTSGNAAKEISSLIGDSRVQVEHILKSTLERVSEGKVVTEQAQSIFEKIAKDTSLMSTQIEGISEAAREQQFGIEQIAKAMMQMDQSTQSNNSAALTAAKLSDQLLGQSRKLTAIAHSVSVLVSGARNAGERSGARSSDDTDGKDNSQGPTHQPQRSSLTTGLSTEQMVNILASKEKDLTPAGTPSISSVSPDDASFKRVG